MSARTVAVAGAGLGGLTAALALLNRGFDVKVFEQSSELREVGAGVQLGPNAMRVYAALGLDRTIAGFSFVPEAHVVRSGKTGAAIATTQMKGVYEAQYGIGFHTMLRADLQNALAAHLPSGVLQFGKKCITVDSRADGVTLHFEDGSAADAAVDGGRRRHPFGRSRTAARPGFAALHRHGGVSRRGRCIRLAQGAADR